MTQFSFSLCSSALVASRVHTKILLGPQDRVRQDTVRPAMQENVVSLTTFDFPRVLSSSPSVLLLLLASYPLLHLSPGGPGNPPETVRGELRLSPAPPLSELFFLHSLICLSFHTNFSVFFGVLTSHNVALETLPGIAGILLDLLGITCEVTVKLPASMRKLGKSLLLEKNTWLTKLQ